MIAKHLLAETASLSLFLCSLIYCSYFLNKKSKHWHQQFLCTHPSAGAKRLVFKKARENKGAPDKCTQELKEKSPPAAPSAYQTWDFKHGISNPLSLKLVFSKALITKALVLGNSRQGCKSPEVYLGHKVSSSLISSSLLWSLCPPRSSNLLQWSSLAAYIHFSLK